jgi:tyrosyl-tRNA synthetase
MQKFSFIEFLRDVGKNFPVNVMMSKDSVRSRLEGETGISYTEFSYMLLQAFDFVHLQRRFGCQLQIGGSDQWGNITAGIDLARRMDGVQVYGMTNPLLTKADGTKMGKTEQGAVWISAERTSPYQFFQYWINTTDDDVSKCLRFLTDLNEQEIAELDHARTAAAHEKSSQNRLAVEVTRLIHGEDGLTRAQKATGILFGGEISQLSDSELGEIFADVPSCEIPANELDSDGLALVDAFARSGLAKSKGEARRTLAQGGVYVNNRREEDPDRKLTRADLASETMIVLRSGRKKYALLRFV